MSTEKEWTVMFLVQIRNETDNDYFEPILDGFMKLELTKKIEVIFCINFTYWPKFSGPHYDSTRPSIEENFNTRLCRLKSFGPGKNELELIEDIPGFDITSPNCIGNKFISRVREGYTAKRYMLFTWDHGNGYSIFKRKQGDFFSRLTMRELDEAIAIGMGSKAPIDMVVMMNCWMHLIDTVFALQKNAKYLVAPQDNVLLNVYDMQTALDKLVRYPKLSAEELSQEIVLAIREKEKNKVKTVAIAAIDLVKLKQHSYFLLLDELATGIEQELGIATRTSILNPSILKKIRAQFLLTHVLDTGNRFVDLFSLLNNLSTVLSEANKKLALQLIACMEESVIEFYTNHPNKERNQWDEPHGINVYSPFTIPRYERGLKKEVIEDVADGFKNTDFRNTDWGVLIESLSDLDFSVISGQIQLPT